MDRNVQVEVVADVCTSHSLTTPWAGSLPKVEMSQSLAPAANVFWTQLDPEPKRTVCDELSVKEAFSAATLTQELVLVARAEASFESDSVETSADAAEDVPDAEASAEVPSLTPPPPPQAVRTAAVSSARPNSTGGRRVDRAERELIMSVSQAKVGYYRSEDRRSFSAGSEEPTRSV